MKKRFKVALTFTIEDNETLFKNMNEVKADIESGKAMKEFKEENEGVSDVSIELEELPI